MSKTVGNRITLHTQEHKDEHITQWKCTVTISSLLRNEQITQQTEWMLYQHFACKGLLNEITLTALGKMQFRFYAFTPSEI